MPSVSIEVRREYTRSEEASIMEAVLKSFREAFKVPSSDRMVRFTSHPPHRFLAPPDLANPDRYTYITIEALPGRSINAKRELYQCMADNLAPLGIPQDHVTIIIHEIARENWGHRGMAASDIDVGFKIEV